MGVNNDVRVTGSAGVSGKTGASVTAARQLLTAAKSHVGTREGPNNENQFTKHVLGDAHQPWCAAFVSTMLENAKIPGISHNTPAGSTGMYSGGCIQLSQQFQSAGRYTPAGQAKPQPGDVIFFGKPEHHTGLVTKVENGRVFTIEGNSSDKVSERAYSLSSPGISGYGKVFADGEIPPDIGIDTSGATAGKADAGAPTRRATGAHASSQAHPDTGLDAWSYFNSTPELFEALLEAILSGDEQAIADALGKLFPAASLEDLGALAKTLKDNPEVMSMLMENPAVLAQLGANPDPQAVQLLLQQKGTLAPSAESANLLSHLERSDAARRNPDGLERVRQDLKPSTQRPPGWRQKQAELQAPYRPPVATTSGALGAPRIPNVGAAESFLPPLAGFNGALRHGYGGDSVSSIIRDGLAVQNGEFSKDEQTMIDSIADPKQKKMLEAQFRMQHMQEIVSFITNMKKKESEMAMSIINNLR